MTTATDPRAGIFVVLEEEHRRYQRLIAVAEGERDALVIADIDALAPLVREMEGITTAIERLEQERIALVARLVGGAAAPSDTFAALMPHFDAAARLRLEDLRTKLREALQALRALNDLNATLLRQALGVTDQWYRLARTALSATYTPAGAVVAPQAVTRHWQV